MHSKTSTGGFWTWPLSIMGLLMGQRIATKETLKAPDVSIQVGRYCNFLVQIFLCSVYLKKISVKNLSNKLLAIVKLEL